jgi:hypothetical protein
MAKGPHRSFMLAVAVAVALVLATSGTASASSQDSHRQAPHAGRVAVIDARAVGGSKRCVAERAKKRFARRLRARCGGRRASTSGAQQSLYWGATIGSQLTGNQAPWDMGAVTMFEAATHKSASLIQFFQPFSECAGSSCHFDAFPITPMENIRSHGSIPVLSWSSQSIPSSLNEPDFQLSDVISGRYDEFIREFATEAKEWGHPFFLRFNWEMNGNWFPWSEGVNGNQPGESVAAWRHVHDIFTSVGAGNVSWVWCPFVDPGGSLQSVRSLYPGDAYVDWTGLDGYNWGTNPASPRGWKSFDQLFSRSYEEITEEVAPTKPMMLGEVGSSEVGGSKPQWIEDALGRLPSEYPQIRAMLWFDKFDDNMDWPIETSTSSTAAFAEAIQEPSYVGASYAELAGGEIQPPS